MDPRASLNWASVIGRSSELAFCLNDENILSPGPDCGFAFELHVASTLDFRPVSESGWHVPHRFPHLLFAPLLLEYLPSTGTCS